MAERWWRCSRRSESLSTHFSTGNIDLKIEQHTEHQLIVQLFSVFSEHCTKPSDLGLRFDIGIPQHSRSIADGRKHRFEPRRNPINDSWADVMAGYFLSVKVSICSANNHYFFAFKFKTIKQALYLCFNPLVVCYLAWLQSQSEERKLCYS